MTSLAIEQPIVKNFFSHPSALQIPTTQFDLFGQMDSRFDRDKKRKENAELATLIEERRRYPLVPAVIRSAWAVLVPTIIELSYHQTDDTLTLLKSVRKTRSMNGSGSAVMLQEKYDYESTFLNRWLFDVLVLIGTLPLDAGDVNDKPVRKKSTPQSIDDLHEAEGGLSSHSRNESMMCLELLCTKAWYATHCDKQSDMHVRAALYEALQFMYWECGVPAILTTLQDEDTELTNPVFEEIRLENYRQIYTAQETGLMASLFQRIEEGTSMLRDRRDTFSQRFNRGHIKDSRRERSLQSSCTVIAEKYKRELKA